ncbi:MAG: hypothetical protein IT449_03555 [Phycisphaerales bacterium]|nr:hypothetical protein [Phycisphaerales bacterium]
MSIYSVKRAAACSVLAMMLGCYPFRTAAAQESGQPAAPTEAKKADGEARLPGTVRPEAAGLDPLMSPYDDERPERDLPPGLRRDFQRPDPHLPFGYRNSPPVARYYQWGGRPYGYSAYNRYPNHDYSYDYGYGAYWRGLDAADPYLYERAYRQGVTDGRRFEQYEREAELGLKSYLDAMEAGQAAFASGNYGKASQLYILAARMSQGDPASRVCAGNSLIALGRYDEAAQILRRAFELQPKLAYLPLDIRGEYQVAGDFETHLAALQAAAERESLAAPGGAPGVALTGNAAPTGSGAPGAAVQVTGTETSADEPNAEPADLWALLGYMNFFGGNPADAKPALDRARKLRPDDAWIRTLHEAARTTSPAR